MKKLIDGILHFRKNLSTETKALYKKIASGQKPEALYIGCSDGRVIPHLITSTGPGDLFVLRNVGNLVPPVSDQENSVFAAIEFAILTLHISDIILCGHSECIAMQTLAQQIDLPPHLKSWLKHGEESLHKAKKGLAPDPTLSEHNQISQINVLQQIEHIKSYPFVHDLLEKKQLRIHGWWFDIAEANVFFYDQTLKKFVLFEEL